MSNSSSIQYSWFGANLSEFHIFLTIVNVFLICVIVAGNSLTITAIWKFKHLQYPSNIMIAALSVVDILVGTMYTPLRLLRTHLPIAFTMEIPCLTIMLIGHVCSITAIWFSSMLSVERCYAVQFPFHYHAHMNVNVAVVYNIVMFVVCVVLCIPMAAGAAQWVDGVECYVAILYPNIYTNLLAVAAIAPFLIGLMCFVRVCATHFSHRRRDRALNSSEQQNQDHIKTTLIITAYACSLFLWTPHIVYYLWVTITKQDHNIIAFRILSLLDLTNSAINCFLYAWKNKKFRIAYTHILCVSTSHVEPSN